MPIHKIESRLIRFLITGGINTLFSYIAFVVVFYLIGQKELSLVLSMIISVAFNYQSYSHLVFADATHRRLYAFLGVYVFTYVVNVAHLRVCVDGFGMDTYLAQFLSLAYIPLLTFWLMKRFVYSLEDSETEAVKP